MALVRTRLLTITAAAAATAFSAAGCGAEDEAKEALDPVAQAAEVTSAQDGGIAMTLKGTIDAAGQKVQMDGAGVMDRDGKAGRMTTKIGDGAGKSMALDEIVDGHVVYVRSGEFEGKLPGGKSWVKVDLDAAAAKEGIDLSALSGAQVQDPAAALDYLKGAGKSTKIGSETVNGTATTHYHVDVDLRKAADKGGADARAAMDKVIKTAGTSTLPVDVWVDAHKLVRREKLNYKMTVQGQSGGMDLTIDFTRYGVKSDTTPPPASDTVDMDELLSSSSSSSTNG